jgi:hypothetical protein
MGKDSVPKDVDNFSQARHVALTDGTPPCSVNRSRYGSTDIEVSSIRNMAMLRVNSYWFEARGQHGLQHPPAEPLSGTFRPQR